MHSGTENGKITAGQREHHMLLLVHVCTEMYVHLDALQM